MAPDGNAGPAAKQVFRIRLEDGGRDFSCPASESVLVAMVRHGLRQVPVGCRGGGCGVCRVRVLSGPYRLGKVARIHLTEDDERRGLALACRLYPQGDLDLRSAPPESGAVDNPQGRN